MPGVGWRRNILKQVHTTRTFRQDVALDAWLSRRVTHCVLSGGALEMLARLPRHSVQTVVTSPPYWGVRDYGVRGQIGMERSLAKYVSNIVAVFEEVRRVLRRDGTVWLNIGDVYASGNRTYRASDDRYAARALHTRPKTPNGLKPKDLIGIPWRVAFALQEAGWYLRADVIWHKTNAMPESVGDRPWRTHEYLFLLSRQKSYLFSPRQLIVDDLSFRRTVWSMGAGRSRLNGHHAVFPERLVIPCIKSATIRGSVVLDPFCGTGTVGLASLRLGRRFIGIELNSTYAKAAGSLLATGARN
jgi:site-specific DNA-methyltransferase (cytosine-N4-specific)